MSTTAKAMPALAPTDAVPSQQNGGSSEAKPATTWKRVVGMCCGDSGDAEDRHLADALGAPWPFQRVTRESKRNAKIVYLVLFLAFIAASLWDIIIMVQKRYEPVNSFSLDREVTTLAMPYMAVCRRITQGTAKKPFDFTTTCVMVQEDTATSTACADPQETTIESTTSEACYVVRADETISASAGADPAQKWLVLSVTADERDPVDMPIGSREFTMYLSADAPPAGEGEQWNVLELEPTTFSLGNIYTSRITKQVHTVLEASLGGLQADTHDEVAYSMTTTYLEPAAVGGEDTLMVKFRASRFGIEQVTDQDPVNVYTLMGTIAGFYGYVVLIFGTVFGASVISNMRRLEDKRILELQAQPGAATTIA